MLYFNTLLMEETKRFRQLTPLELQYMFVIWEKEAVFINDILEALPGDKPAYNTISTIVRILVKKGVVAYNNFGRSHQYYSLISRESYLASYLENIKDDFFDGSPLDMISFIVKNSDISPGDLDSIKEIAVRADV